MSSGLSLINTYDYYGSQYSPYAMSKGKGGGTTVNSSGFSHKSGSFAVNPDYAGSDYSLTSGKAEAGLTDSEQDYLSSSGEGSGLDPNGVDWIGYYENGINPFGSSASSKPSETPQPYAFMDTSLASMFGMDPATHYQEALANTAYQRQVRDLQAAGLNPVLGISGNGASVFPGTYMPVSSGGSGGDSYGSSGSGKSTSKLAGVAKTLSYSAPYLVGGVVGLATKNPYAAGLAQSATQTLVNLVKYN